MRYLIVDKQTDEQRALKQRQQQLERFLRARNYTPLQIAKRIYPDAFESTPEPSRFRAANTGKSPAIGSKEIAADESRAMPFRRSA